MSMLSKREFLVGAGATMALGVMSSKARAARHSHFDLIVVGGGNAGLPTAIFAAERGAQVAIVDAASADLAIKALGARGMQAWVAGSVSVTGPGTARSALEGDYRKR